MSSDVETGFRALQVSTGAAAICSMCGYFAAKQLSNPYLEDSTRDNRAMLISGLGITVVVVASVYSMFILYRGSARTKMLAMIALLISFGGSYAGWTIGWKRGGDPVVVRAI